MPERGTGGRDPARLSCFAVPLVVGSYITCSKTVFILCLSFVVCSCNRGCLLWFFFLAGARRGFLDTQLSTLGLRATLSHGYALTLLVVQGDSVGWWIVRVPCSHRDSILRPLGV